MNKNKLEQLNKAVRQWWAIWSITDIANKGGKLRDQANINFQIVFDFATGEFFHYEHVDEEKTPDKFDCLTIGRIYEPMDAKKLQAFLLARIDKLNKKRGATR